MCRHSALVVRLIVNYRAGLHDNVLADLLPRWQKVRQSRATQPRCTDVPDWVTASAVQPTLWDSDSFNVKVGLGRCRATQPSIPNQNIA